MKRKYEKPVVEINPEGKLEGIFACMEPIGNMSSQQFRNRYANMCWQPTRGHGRRRGHFISSLHDGEGMSANNGSCF